MDSEQFCLDITRRLLAGDAAGAQAAVDARLEPVARGAAAGALCAAVAAGAPALLDRLLSLGAPADVPGRSPLLVAGALNRLDCARVLLAHGATADIDNAITAAFSTAKPIEERLELIEALVDAAPPSRAALAAAADAGLLGPLRRLLRQVPPVERQVVEMRMFSEALRAGRADVVRVLLEHGVRATSNLTDKAIENAVAGGHVDALAVVLTEGDAAWAGARIARAAVAAARTDVLRMMIDRKIKLPDDFIDEVANLDDVESMYLLLEHGVAPTRRAVERAARRGHEALLRALLAAAPGGWDDDALASALVCARSAACAAALLGAGKFSRAALDAALRAALMHGASATLRLLLAAGADPRAADDIMDLALARGHAENVLLLIKT